jgi:putative peptide zinc metalloprotease protein
MSKAQNRARRVTLRLGLFLGAVTALATLVPLPFSARGEGRIVVLPGAEIVAATSGVAALPDVEGEAAVTAGQRVILLENPAQTARLQALRMNVAYLEDAVARSGLTLADRDRIARELDVARAALENAEALERALALTAPMDGRMSWNGGRPPVPGSFVFRGDQIGHVVNAGALEIVAAFPAAYSGYADPAAELHLLLPDGTEVVRPIARSLVIDVGQQAPPELLASAGGPIPEQQDNPGMALDTSWILWASPGADLTAWSGARVQARVDLGRASAFSQLQFHIQRLFLRVMRV